MHELSLSRAILNTAVKHAAGGRVCVIDLKVGRLRQVVPDTLEFYFQFVARGTICDGARLRQEIVEVRLRCEQCEREWEIVTPAFGCEACGAGGVVVAGDELEVASIEVEETACIAQG